MPRAMVVKQSAPDDNVQMHNESKLLHMLACTGTNHVVKLFKSHHYSGGTGTTVTQDPLPLHDGKYDSDYDISRMYLELADGGDMYDWIRKLQRANPTGKPPEEHMWRIFGCLMRALLVLETGNEDPNSSDPYWSKCFYRSPSFARVCFIILVWPGNMLTDSSTQDCTSGYQNCEHSNWTSRPKRT